MSYGLSRLVMQLAIFVKPEDWTITMGFFPEIFKPAAIEQATPSLAAGKYSILGLFIASLIRFLAKLHGTTHK